MADVDYDEVVEGTIEAVKEQVEDEDLDPAKVLDAEQANKDRVTLVDWLENRIGDEAPDEEEPSSPGAAGDGPAQDAMVDRVIAGATSHLFIAGLIVGVAAAIAVVPAGAGTLSPSAVGDDVETYFSQNADGVPLEGVEVQGVRRLPDSTLYQVDMVLSAQFLNRTVQQNQTAIVSGSGRYLFLSQPIDTQQPLADQLSGAQQPQQQQQ